MVRPSHALSPTARPGLVSPWRVVRAGLIGVAIVVVAGCGSTSMSTGPSSTVRSSVGTLPSQVPDGNGGAGGGETNNGEANTGEAPSVPFESPKYHYKVSAPGAMTEGADGTAKASFGAEALTISVLSGPSAGDPTAVAKAAMDKAGSTPKFKLMSAPATTKLTASKATLKAVYSGTEGTNAVTGKPNDVVVVKYWVPKDASTLAVLTYSVTQTQYDPQGADDVANTFQWQ